MEPNNAGLEDDFPCQRGDFRVPCWFFGEYVLLVLLKVEKHYSLLTIFQFLHSSPHPLIPSWIDGTKPCPASHMSWGNLLVWDGSNIVIVSSLIH